jgi:DNA processing protein
LDGRDPKLNDSAVGAAEVTEPAPWESDPDYATLWDCLGYDPCPVDEIIRQSGLTARAVSAMLLMLELRGMVEAHPGGAYSRKKNRGI